MTRQNLVAALAFMSALSPAPAFADDGTGTDTEYVSREEYNALKKELGALKKQASPSTINNNVTYTYYGEAPPSFPYPIETTVTSDFLTPLPIEDPALSPPSVEVPASKLQCHTVAKIFLPSGEAFDPILSKGISNILRKTLDNFGYSPSEKRDAHFTLSLDATTFSGAPISYRLFFGTDYLGNIFLKSGNYKLMLDFALGHNLMEKDPNALGVFFPFTMRGECGSQYDTSKNLHY